jgi:hypothetical protein
MRKIFLTFFIFLLVFGLFLPNPNLVNAGLVPCGTSEHVGTTDESCNLCHAFELTNSVFNFVTTIIIPALVVIMVAWGAIVLLTSGGNQENVKKGRKIITSAIIGAIIVYAAFLIVGTVLGVIVSESDMDGFFKFKGGVIQIECGT